MSVRIRQLLDHARREAPRRERLDVGPWVADVIDLLRPLAERRGIDLRLEHGREEAADLDAGQMRHVLINLVTNAIEASPDGAEVEVRVALDDGALRIEVSDHGEGISEDRLDQVFEPFFTTKAPGEGTGLGLSIARGIVKEHGGSLTARAGERGTTFVVVVPLGLPAARDGTESA
jgi:two-component system, NtrC family, sensor kinase